MLYGLWQSFRKVWHRVPDITIHFDHGVLFWKLSQKLLAEGNVKSHPVALPRSRSADITGGSVQAKSADEIQADREQHRGVREGMVMAGKLVYKVYETDEGHSGQEKVAQSPQLDPHWQRIDLSHDIRLAKGESL
jgi:hypothetical protein